MKYASLALAAFAATLLLIWWLTTPPEEVSGLVNPPHEPQGGTVSSPETLETLSALKSVRELAERLEAVELPEVLPIEPRERLAAPTEDLVTWSILERAFGIPHLMPVEELSRHADLNPTGKRLPDSAITAFEALHAFYVPTLDQLLVAVADLPNQEVLDLAQRGLLRPLEYSTNPKAVADMERIKAENAAHGLHQEPLFTAAFYYQDATGLRWFARHAGRNYGAKDKDLKQYCAGMIIVAQSAHDFYMRLALLAYHLGTLDEPMLESRTRMAALWLRDKRSKFTVGG